MNIPSIIMKTASDKHKNMVVVKFKLLPLTLLIRMESCSINTLILHRFISFSSLQYKQKLGNSFLHLCKRKSSEVFLSYEARQWTGSEKGLIRARLSKGTWEVPGIV